MEHAPTLLYLAHLRWDHVWQRPQQLMSRFADNSRVIYVDPPEIMAEATTPHLISVPGKNGVEVLRPIFPGDQCTSSQDYESLWLALLPEVLAVAGPRPLLWVSSPLADYLVAAAQPHVRMTVYDCMDDLASFRDGTSEMRRRELRLMSMAELVFTGGHAMYAARKQLHPRTYCFPSGVDTTHYRQTQEPTTRIPELLANLPHPRLGYFGVLDERIDWELIAATAERRPEWQWVLVGPTAKVEPDELPQSHNIHYLGQQEYEDLPAFLKGFDIATMPFALNEATRYISPTKTLEYLAGGKSVISTSVPDVAAFYQGVVYLADGVDGWITTIESMLAASGIEQAGRQRRASIKLAEANWDSIAHRMWALIVARLEYTFVEQEVLYRAKAA